VLSIDDRPSFLYLKGRHQTEPERRLSNLLSRFQKAGLSVTMDDPNEARIQPLTWYGAKTNSAIAVLAHLSGSSREGWLLHNARYAFVCGLAHGFEKPILMLAESDYAVPFDYRHLLVKYSTARECIERAQPFLDGAMRKFAELQLPREIRLRAVEPLSLRKLYLGELAAENETDRLDSYFVETAEFHDALRERFTVFVGRKGSGKTANLFRLAERLGEDARNLVVVVKPLDYDLDGVVRLLRSYRQRDTKGYVIESLWKLLIYCEVARVAAEVIEKRPIQTWTPDEHSFLGFADTHFPLFREDFSVRLERAARDLLGVGEKDGIEATQIAVSESLHVGFLRELRTMLGKVLRNKRRVAVLVDNLDKNWNANGDLQELAALLLGLLGAASRLPTEFRKEDAWRSPINLTLTLFVRNDIFQRVLRVAQEPDKIGYSRIVWNDPQLLFHVLERRILRDQGPEVTADQAWSQLFEPMVGGIPTPDYVAETILPRPRDIIFLAGLRPNPRGGPAARGEVL
jgi:hypothetical protein